MQMTFRWYGEGNDSVSLADIKQIPGVTGIVWALHHKQAGEIWTVDEIMHEKKIIEDAGFNIDVVESVNVHDDIKIGLPTRDQYIENYKITLRNLAQCGVKVVTYNFMPVFDWTRTDLFHPLPDGSTALYYEKSVIREDAKEMADYILKGCKGYTMPGWEPERMAQLDELFEKYKPVTKEKLWENLKYFLEAIMPTCEETGIKMAIHQDDPPLGHLRPAAPAGQQGSDRQVPQNGRPSEQLPVPVFRLARRQREERHRRHHPLLLRPHRVRARPQRQAL